MRDALVLMAGAAAYVAIGSAAGYMAGAAAWWLVAR